MNQYPNDPTTGHYPPPGYPPQGYGPPQQPGYPPPYPQHPMPPGYPPMMPQQPMQPPKKKSKALWIVLGIIGVVVLCSAIGSIASRGNTGTKVDTTANTGSSTTDIGNSQPKQPTMQQHFKIGDVVKVGDKWEVTVNSITTSQGGNYITPDPGNVYVLVNVSMKNTSPQEQNTSSLLDWNLKGKDGQRYKDALFSDGDSPPNGKIEAGGPAKGTLSYEAPATVKDFTLSFSPELFSSGQTIWDLSV